jgi:hypothetical protein
LGKGKRAGGKGKTPFFFLPSLPIRNRGGPGRPRPVADDGAPGVGGDWGKGKTEGESRGSQPRAHLGPGLLVEAAPRCRAAAGNGGWGSGVWRLGEAGRLGWGGARRGWEPRRAFYRRGEVGSGKKNLPDDLRRRGCGVVRTMCGSRTGGWSLPCVMSD